MTVDLRLGDCREVMKTLPDGCFDAILTDPPAGIGFMGKAWDHDHGGRDKWIEWMSEIAAECLRIVKPGAHVFVWALPRTSHWTATSWENAGFEVRDRVAHLFGSGFPKSHDVSKAIDKAAGVEMETRGHFQFTAADKAATPGAFRTNEERAEPGCRKLAPATDAAKTWDGWGTALKPACEDWWLLRKPLEGTVAENCLRYGTGALNIDGCRVGMMTPEEVARSGKSTAGVFSPGGVDWRADGHPPQGRWPANVAHDGSDEVVAGFPQTGGGKPATGKARPRMSSWHSKDGRKTVNSIESVANAPDNYGDSGSAARFFYCAKASRAEREVGCEGLEAHAVQSHGSITGDGSTFTAPDGTEHSRGASGPARNYHPTVKAIALTKWLATMLLPPPECAPRRILVPFAGSGSEMIGAFLAGWEKIVGIEIDRGYFEIAKRRIEEAQLQMRLPEEGTPCRP